MKVTGIIAEYNPFHNGHLYHLEKARELTEADYLIVIMSGNFVQRGAPAFIDKYTRARMALSCGADLVLELPLYYATGSAEYFATGAVSLLDKLGIVDAVCFGSECGDITALSEIAQILSYEPALYQKHFQSALRAGQSYPAAQHSALTQYLSDAMPHRTINPDILNSPNNILGIEYCKALLKRNSRIIPYTIKREGGGYHDTVLFPDHSSALAIRSMLQQTPPTQTTIPLMQTQAHSLQVHARLSQVHARLSQVQCHMPDTAYMLLQDVYDKSAPITPEDISLILQYRLLSCETADYTQFLDVSEELSNKIAKNLRHYKNFPDFCNLLKTKELTYTRVSRALLHILLAMTKEHMQQYKDADYILYARMLGFRQDAAPLLSYCKQTSAGHEGTARGQSMIPLISKMADAETCLSRYAALTMLQEDVRAAHIYNAVIQNKFGVVPPNEYQSEIIRIL